LGFGKIDLLIVIVYLAGVTLVGVYFRRQRNLDDYFLGGRTTPWWAIALSIVATETSTLTIIGTPAIAYGGNLTFLQLVMGYIVARFLISALLLPKYFEGNQLTAYGYIDQRFGGVTRRLAAGLFLITRLLADAVRIWAIAIVVQLVLPRISSLVTGEETQVAELTAVLVVMGLTLVYTFLGGMRAVIWTDVVQFTIYLGGGFVVLWSLFDQIPGGLSTTVATAYEKLLPVDFTFAWDTPYTFWAGILGGTFLTLASHGTDQLMVQRVLAARNLRDGRRALIASGFIVFVQFALFLLIGSALYVFYVQLFPDQVFASADRVFPTFMVNNLPPVVSGLMVAGVLAAAMSTASSSLNSLSASTVVDFYQPLFGQQASQEKLLRLSRWLTIVWGAVLVGMALLASNWGPVLEAGLTIASFTYGALLGLFLLGRFVQRCSPAAAATGMVAGLALIAYVKFFTPLAWTWYVLVGTLATFLVGWSLSLVMPKKIENE
jgi:SSS family transporter